MHAPGATLGAMCTVVIEVPASERGEVRLLAVRDEDPARAWDPPGAWWPETFPGVHGVRDRRAGGAWLAAEPRAGRLAVLLNRAAEVAEPAGGFGSRGALPLAAVRGVFPAAPPPTPAFTLVSISPGRAEVISWDGIALRREPLAPGVHMVDHREVDDPASPRIARWLPEFRAAAAPQPVAEHAGPSPSPWRERWHAVLARSAELDRHDDRAIIRDNTPLGYATQSLLVCRAAAGGAPASPELTLDWAALAAPGRWAALEFEATLPVRAAP